MIAGCDPTFEPAGGAFACSCPCGWWHRAWSELRAKQVVNRHRAGRACCVVKAHQPGATE